MTEKTSYGPRVLTQPQERVVHERYASAGGLAWWSSHEALWKNVTLFDRAAAPRHVLTVRKRALDDPAVVEAAYFLELRLVPQQPL